MFAIDLSTAYITLALFASLAARATHLVFSDPQIGKAMRVMALCGAIGGPAINGVYQLDFWQPASLFPWWFPLESAAFGAGFLSLVTGSALYAAGVDLAPERTRSVKRETKVWTLIALSVFAFVVFLFDFNSVLATTAGMTVGTGFMIWSRRGLVPFAVAGLVASITAFAVLVGGFVLLAENREDLAREFSLFYVKRGALPTAAMLTLWATAFGAFFGAFYPWWKNLRRI